MPMFRTTRGRPLPLGASVAPEGANFALLCRHGRRVSLVILPEEGGTTPLAELPLDPCKNRTGDHWHIRVHDLPDASSATAGASTARPGRERGFDPVATAARPRGFGAARTARSGPARAKSTRSARPGGASSAAHQRYDWGDDAPPLTEYEDSLIYEVHVRGFTCDPSSKVRLPGHLPRT